METGDLMTDLRAIRKRLGLSQAELAAELGVTRHTIIEREAGRVKVAREVLLALRWLEQNKPAIEKPTRPSSQTRSPPRHSDGRAASYTVSPPSSPRGFPGKG